MQEPTAETTPHDDATLRAAYEAGYNETATWHDRVATTIPSDGNANVYGFFPFPLDGSSVEWERTLPNVRYATERRVVGVVDDHALATARADGAAVKRHPGRLIAELLRANPPVPDAHSGGSPASQQGAQPPPGLPSAPARRRPARRPSPASAATTPGILTPSGSIVAPRRHIASAASWPHT